MHKFKKINVQNEVKKQILTDSLVGPRFPEEPPFHVIVRPCISEKSFCFSFLSFPSASWRPCKDAIMSLSITIYFDSVGNLKLWDQKTNFPSTRGSNINSKMANKC